jgi:cytochrome c-type biogenesis protein CcmH/NrfF
MVINLAAIPLMAVVVAATIWLAQHRRRTDVQAAKPNPAE